MKHLSLFVAGLIFAFAAYSTVNAATFVVNTTADTQDIGPGDGVCADSGGQCSLRAAITEANALPGADTITLPAGTYTETLVAANENLNTGGDFDITSPVTINGAGISSTFVQSASTPHSASERVFHITGAGSTSVTITSLTIQNGFNTSAGGVGGGGARVDGGDTVNAAFTDVAFVNNRSQGRGGGFAANHINSVTLTNCSFTGNDAVSDTGNAAGGAVDMDTEDNVSDPGMTGNFTNCTFNNNDSTTTAANSFGGAIIVRAIDSTNTFTNCTFNANTTHSPASGNGGGIYNQNATMNLNNCVISNNTSTHFVGGIRALAGASGNGGTTTTNISNTTISGNTAPSSYGGAFNVATGTFDATMNIVGSTVSGNSSDPSTGFAGGVGNTGSVGGATILNMLNSTISGNSAADAGGGYNDGSNATAILDYCTVANNQALGSIATGDGLGGGWLQDTTPGGSTTISDTIIGDNTAGVQSPDIAGVITSLGFNHIENSNCGTGCTFVTQPGDVTGTDPQLGPLANNGGRTMTHLPGISPVIDTIPNGVNGCGSPVNVDQRGRVRPFPSGGFCDKGAVEVGGVDPTPTPTPTISPGITPSPTPTPSRTPTPTPTRSPTPTPTPTPSPTPTPKFDFDGDRRADIAVFRPSGAEWWLNRSGLGPVGLQFGIPTDVPVVADYTGDTKTDIAIYRPFTSEWLILRSENSSYYSFPFGINGDIPVPGDYDGDGRTDAAVYRPSLQVWFILRSTGGISIIPFGLVGDVKVPADYDGDGKTDLAFYRPNDGVWYIQNSRDGSYTFMRFGTAEDKPVPADYDGDRRADIAVYRPSTGIWYMQQSLRGFAAIPWGLSTDKPAPADYDGDGKADTAVFRPSDGAWYILRSSGGTQFVQWGTSGDVPIPGQAVP